MTADSYTEHATPATDERTESASEVPVQADIEAVDVPDHIEPAVHVREIPPPPIAAPEPPVVIALAAEHMDVPEPEAAEEPEAGEAAAAPPPPPPPPPADSKHWYIVKVQSGREESIKEAIERRVKIEGLEEHFDQIKIPVEKVTELRNGKRVVRSRKKFPGYLMAHVEFNDRILYLFRETSGVGDFVGATVNRAPTPMPPHEVERMLAEEAIAEGTAKGAKAAFDKIKLKFDKGDRVRVRDGTFQGMEGEVKDILEPKEAKDPVRVKIELTIFGRPVPVEVEAWQVDPV